MFHRRILAAGVVLSLLGCSGPDRDDLATSPIAGNTSSDDAGLEGPTGPGHAIATRPPMDEGDAAPAGGTEGSLRVEIGDSGAACMWLETRDPSNTNLARSLRWPDGYALHSDPWRILDERGRIVARTGDIVHLGGATWAPSEDEVCVGHRGWSVHSVVVLDAFGDDPVSRPVGPDRPAPRN
jgi:hypothetical protein